MKSNNPIDRRQFMSASLLALGGSAVRFHPSAIVVNATKATTRAQEDWIEEIRAQIPATKESVYFQTGGDAPSTIGTMEKVKTVLDRQNKGPADPRVGKMLEQIEPDLRAHIAHALGARTDEVALTHSTTEGIDIAIWSVDWKEGDEVIISNQEHPANVVPWYNLRNRFGIAIREINLDTGTGLISEVRSKLTLRTKMVSLSHVTRNNGRRLRAEESADLAGLLQKNRIRYHLDGAQGPGNVPVDFHTLGCDYYSLCGHKWLLGPKGTGACLIRKDILEETAITWIGSHSHSTMTYDGRVEWKPDASRFEFGTRALADFAGFDHALLEMERIGFERVFRRIEALVDMAVERALQSKKYRIASPVDKHDRSGVFVLRLPEGCDGTIVYDKLWENHGILTSPVRVESDLRISIHFFNTEDEIEALFKALEKYCS